MTIPDTSKSPIPTLVITSKERLLGRELPILRTANTITPTIDFGESEITFHYGTVQLQQRIALQTIYSDSSESTTPDSIKIGSDTRVDYTQLVPGYNNVVENVREYSLTGEGLSLESTQISNLMTAAAIQVSLGKLQQVNFGYDPINSVNQGDKARAIAESTIEETTTLGQLAEIPDIKFGTAAEATEGMKKIQTLLEMTDDTYRAEDILNDPKAKEVLKQKGINLEDSAASKYLVDNTEIGSVLTETMKTLMLAETRLNDPNSNPLQVALSIAILGTGFQTLERVSADLAQASQFFNRGRTGRFIAKIGIIPTQQGHFFKFDKNLYTSYSSGTN